MLFHTAIVTKDGILLFSYYFVPIVSPAAGGDALAIQDAWERRLNLDTRDSWADASEDDVVLSVDGRFVLLREKAGLIFMLSCAQDGADDEFTLAEHMDRLIPLVTATCDGRLTPAQIISFTGKLCVCVNEMFFAGMRVYDDVEVVLRNAKLKAPAV